MAKVKADAPRRRKSLGQHFLADSNILRRIVAAAALDSEDVVVEVGPGSGALTRPLTRKAGQVIAVEIDPVLAAALPARLGNPPNLTVIQGDARTVELPELAAGNRPFKVVSNLPYYAANPIVRRFLEAERQPLRMVVMVQKEVAQTMTATPGRMTLLSVAVRFYGSPRMVCSVPPRAFRPPPKVHSAVVSIDVQPESRKRVDDESRFFQLVRAGFAAPRKQLRNSLAQGLGVSGSDASDLLTRTDIDPRRRPGTLTVEEWIALYKSLPGSAITSDSDESTPGLHR